MDLTTCNVGKFLVVHTFVASCLQVRLDARAPSGESWNYLSRRLSLNVKTLPLHRHLGIRFLLQIYVKGAMDTFSLCALKA